MSLNLEEVVARWPYAVVHLHSKVSAQSIEVPAAQVFTCPDGFAFLEPGYLDPDGAEHRFHRIACQLAGTISGTDLEPERLAFDGPEWEGWLQRYYMPGGSEPALERYAAQLLEQRGRTVAEEHAHQRQHLAEDLA